MNQRAILGKEGIWKIFERETEEKLSYWCSYAALQDPFSLRVQRRSRLLSEYLMDHKGEFYPQRIEESFRLLKETPYYIYVDGYNDSEISKHFLFVLEELKNPRNVQLLKKIPALQRRLTLSGCFSLLRQNVGSCFATAPAILIQREQVHTFLLDVSELLTTGKLKRTVGGIERAVPLCRSTGIGDLKKKLFEERHCFIPSLMEGFCAAGLISSQLSLEEKITRSAALAREFLEKEGQSTIEHLLRTLLLRHYGVTGEQVSLFEKMEKEGSLRPRAGFSLTHIPKKDLCEQVLQKENEGRNAFKAFTDHPLVKAWEYTLASFSEAKMEFSSWNLYASLGLNPEERGGIGEALYAQIQGKLEESNKKTEALQRNYEIAFDQLRATETLLKQASTEVEFRRLRAEHQSRLHHFYSCQELRDQSHLRSTKYAALFSFLIKQYVGTFEEYFQEIYDPEMRDVEGPEYDDAPAGFRLVYKHGRSDPSLWTPIDTPKQYIDALIDFFLSIEHRIAAALGEDTGSQEVSMLTTAIVAHLQTEEFLQTALARASSLQKEKKPWAYLSGGSIAMLLKNYFRRESPITEESRWVESPIDLLIFLLDILKTLPSAVAESFLKEEQKHILAYSPTHAFLLLPGLKYFSTGWQEEIFTYTWVRDTFLTPHIRFYESMHLPSSAQEYLVSRFSEQLPTALAHAFHSKCKPFSAALLPQKMYERMWQDLVSCAPRPLHRELSEMLAGFLYEMLPLISKEDVSKDLSLLLEEKVDVEVSSPWIGALELKHKALVHYIEKKKTRNCGFDLHGKIGRRAVSCGLAPQPLVFADTNWTGKFFAFIVSPATVQLELWRCDLHGFCGRPMSLWKPYVDGTKKEPWGVYTRPYEYLF